MEGSSFGAALVFMSLDYVRAFSQPQRRCVATCAFAHSLEFCPDDGRMDFRFGTGLGTKAAIATRNHPFASHHIRITLDPVRDQLGVFDEHG